MTRGLSTAGSGVERENESLSGGEGSDMKLVPAWGQWALQPPLGSETPGAESEKLGEAGGWWGVGAGGTRVEEPDGTTRPSGETRPRSHRVPGHPTPVWLQKGRARSCVRARGESDLETNAEIRKAGRLAYQVFCPPS